MLKEKWKKEWRNKGGQFKMDTGGQKNV